MSVLLLAPSESDGSLTAAALQAPTTARQVATSLVVALVVSRAGVDLVGAATQNGEGQAVLSFMTHVNQIGQTGTSPRHRKGLAMCCQAGEPRVVGWRFITERRAVNLNPNCGWAQGKTDVLYVADAFEVMKKVQERLAAR